MFLQPLGERPIPLLSFPLWPGLSGSHLLSHGHFTLQAFPLCCWKLLKSGPTWASPRIGSVPFKDSQINSQKLIKMEFHALLVPLGDVKGDPIQSPGNPSQKRLSPSSLKPRPPHPGSLSCQPRSSLPPFIFRSALPFPLMWHHQNPGPEGQRERDSPHRPRGAGGGVSGWGAGIRLQSQLQRWGCWWKERGCDI